MDSPNTQTMEVYQMPSELTTSTMLSSYNSQFHLLGRNRNLISSLDINYCSEPKFSECTVISFKQISSTRTDILLESINVDYEDINIKPIYKESFKINIVVKSVRPATPT